MKTAFVTGIAGFLGSSVAEHLLKMGFAVVGLDDLSGGFLRNVPGGTTFYRGSILDEAMVERIFSHHKVNYVFHLAAYAAEGLSPHIRKFNYLNNVVGSAIITNAAINFEVSGIVFTSSIATFGHQSPPFLETTPLRADDPYSAAKICTVNDLKDAGKRFGLRSIIFNPFNVYGPKQNTGDTYRNVLGIHFNQCLLGKPRTIFGTGEQVRAFSYIDDVAPAIAESVTMDLWGQTFNIGGSKPSTVNRVSELISSAMRVPHEVVYFPRRDEAVVAYCNIDKARKIFSHLMPDVSLEDGVQRMARWVKEIGPQPKTPSPRIEIQKNLPSAWTHQP